MLPRFPKSSFSSAFSTPCAQRLLAVAALTTGSGERPFPPIQGEAAPRPPGKREGFLCALDFIYTFSNIFSAHKSEKFGETQLGPVLYNPHSR